MKKDTDKTYLEIWNSASRYTSKWSQYPEIYEFWFSKFRNESPLVVEVGVDNGGSIETWKKYFGEGSHIVGIDKRMKISHIEGCELVLGDQGDSNFWESFVNQYPNINVFIDDGSHFPEHQSLTFYKVFPHMADGGIYLCEDTHSNYMDLFGGRYGRDDFIGSMKDCIDILHTDHRTDPYAPKYSEWTRHIKSLHFYDSVVVIEKGYRSKEFVTFVRKEEEIR